MLETVSFSVSDGDLASHSVDSARNNGNNDDRYEHRFHHQILFDLCPDSCKGMQRIHIFETNMLI